MTVTLTSDDPRGILLFAPGAGGDPSRYRRLLEAANASGFIVAASAHALLDGQTASDDELRDRVLALRELLADVGRPELPVVVAGHSAGGWAALCLVGAAARNRDGVLIGTPTEPRVARVVLLAPATAWLDGPAALQAVTVPLTVLVGSEDTVTPPETAEMLRDAPAPVDLRSYEGVGHFDFMSPLPLDEEPTPGLDHQAFTDRLTGDFVAALG